MDFNNVKDIAVYGTDCIADISCDGGETVRFISAKEKYFDVQCDGNGMLTVAQKKGNLLYKIIMRRMEFKLVLPESFKGRLRFRNKNGGLYIKNGNFTDIELYTKNGKFDIGDLSCNEFNVKMSNGNITVKNMNVSRETTVKCSNGNIRAERIVSPICSISCTNAGVSATDIRSDKFECSTSNGTIDVGAVATDDMRLDTNNGKINAMVLGARSDYRLWAETEHGTVTVDGEPCKNISDVVTGKKRLSARTCNGDIDIRFVR